MISQAQFPQPVRAVSEPLGWYLRPSYVDHVSIADVLDRRLRDKRRVLERLRVGLGSFVQIGSVASFSQKPLRRAQRG